MSASCGKEKERELQLSDRHRKLPNNAMTSPDKRIHPVVPAHSDEQQKRRREKSKE
jgi:hypothetical protein